MQGNCSGQPVPDGLQLNPPLAPHQCVMTVQEGFLEVSGSDTSLWLSHLYIRIAARTEKNHSTLLAVQNGNLWLTFVTLVGDGYRCRAIHVHEGRHLYARGAPQSPCHLALLVPAGCHLQDGTSAA